MRGHGEAASDRRRWRARPSLANRPVTRSLGGGWVGSSWLGVPRGLLPAVGRSWCPLLVGLRERCTLVLPATLPQTLLHLLLKERKDLIPLVPGGAPLAAPPIETAMTPLRQHRPDQRQRKCQWLHSRRPRVDASIVQQLVTTAEIARRLGPAGSGQARRFRRSDADCSAHVVRVGSGEGGALIWYWPAAERWARRRRAGGQGLDVADAGPRRVTWSAAIPHRGQCQWLHSRRASSVPWSWEGG